ncbi:uncharacterized protein [Halyomorpha halys]|uniref:uncharacterized protein n=1 Tax=Halyomorpha halys TaxID=286706 RepID=UPI0006D51946|nr:uncharacterized protein LOC106686648 [Halyomorpha halys]
MVYWLYITAVRPMVSYAALVWWHRVKVVTYRNILDRLQRLACHMITGAMSTTPTAVMEVMLRLTPMHLEIEAQAQNTTYRFVKQDGRSNAQTMAGHGKIIQRIDEDRVLSMHLQIRKYKGTKLSVKIDKTKIHKPKNGINCYTDSFLTAQGSGASIWRGDKPLEGISIPIGRHISLLKTAIQLSRTNRVSIKWVPGHCGITSKEHTDRLARKGSETIPFTPEPVCGNSLSFAKSSIKAAYGLKAKQHWLDKRIRQAKLFLDEPCRGQAEELLRLDRTSLRIITGHCRLNKHMFNLKLTESPLCRFCNADDETAYHIICWCDQFALLGLDRVVDPKQCELINPLSILNFFGIYQT